MKGEQAERADSWCTEYRGSNRGRVALGGRMTAEAVMRRREGGREGGLLKS